MQALLVADNTAGDVGAVARLCGLDTKTLQNFYEWFGSTERVVTLFSQGVNQSSSGTDKANSIINAHLLTGRIGRAGTGPFSITGQPNAMGGREVGGLANTLAAHMELENARHRRVVQKFWAAPRIAERPGLKAVDLGVVPGHGRHGVCVLRRRPQRHRSCDCRRLRRSFLDRASIEGRHQLWFLRSGAASAHSECGYV